MQIVLESITIKEGGENSIKKESMSLLFIEDDTHLIDSWLNVSTDPIIGDGESRNYFWLRVTKITKTFVAIYEENIQSSKILMAKN